jgi:hypothetical protein
VSRQKRSVRKKVRHAGTAQNGARKLRQKGRKGQGVGLQATGNRATAARMPGAGEMKETEHIPARTICGRVMVTSPGHA